ncbi:MAG: hypothetical protein K0Q51_524 [Rickettsiaceae bacterium]|jgi:hypothetical protein|nr:hypothetical protein [Rickettsiaceae bacterium]
MKKNKQRQENKFKKLAFKPSKDVLEALENSQDEIPYLYSNANSKLVVQQLEEGFIYSTSGSTNDSDEGINFVG